MTALVLRLAGPLQSWGSSSRFTRRSTERAPTKSGVLGMLAAAQGRRRTDPVADLAGLRFGVRIDQPGSVLRDFHTAHTVAGKSMPLSNRYYLQDAVFVAAVEGEDGLVRGLEQAVRRPAFPLFLGRRSCPPAGPVALGVHAGTVEEALDSEPWHAAQWYMRVRREAWVELETVVDLPSVGASVSGHRESVRDHPLSFDSSHREYGWRFVSRDHWVRLPNPLAPNATGQAADDHDPMAELEV